MSERAIVHGAPHDIGVALRDLQLDPPVRYLCRPIGPDFFLLGIQKAALWHQNSRYGRLSGEARETEICKHKLGLSSVPHAGRSNVEKLFRDPQHLRKGEWVMSAHDGVCVHEGQQSVRWPQDASEAFLRCSW